MRALHYLYVLMVAVSVCDCVCESATEQSAKIDTRL